MIYQVCHSTRYTYGERVLVSLNQVCQQPRDTLFQRRTEFRLVVEPKPATWRTFTDYFGNQQAVFTLNQPHQIMDVRAESRVEVLPRCASNPAESPAWEIVRDALPHPARADDLDAYQYCFASPFVPVGRVFAAFAQASFPAGRPIRQAVRDFTRRIRFEQQIIRLPKLPKLQALLPR